SSETFGPCDRRRRVGCYLISGAGCGRGRCAAVRVTAGQGRDGPESDAYPPPAAQAQTPYGEGGLSKLFGAHDCSPFVSEYGWFVNLTDVGTTISSLRLLNLRFLDKTLAKLDKRAILQGKSPQRNNMSLDRDLRKI